MYPLRWHSEKAGAAHYLVELVAVRQAKRDGTLLTMGFWKDPVWKTWYAGQIIAAQSLVKTFQEENVETIVESINELNWVTSLRTRALKELVYDKLAKKAAQTKREVELITPKEEIVINTRESSGVRRKTKVGDIDL